MTVGIISPPSIEVNIKEIRNQSPDHSPTKTANFTLGGSFKESKRNESVYEHSEDGSAVLSNNNILKKKKSKDSMEEVQKKGEKKKVDGNVLKPSLFQLRNKKELFELTSEQKKVVVSNNKISSDIDSEDEVLKDVGIDKEGMLVGPLSPQKSKSRSRQ